MGLLSIMASIYWNQLQSMSCNEHECMLDLIMIWSVAKKGHAQNEIAKDMMLQSKVLSQLVPCPQWKHSFYTRSMHCTFLPWILILGSFTRCSKHAKSVDSMQSQHGDSAQLACCTMQQYISLIQDLSVTGRCIPSPLWGKVKWQGGWGCISLSHPDL